MTSGRTGAGGNSQFGDEMLFRSVSVVTPSE